MDSKSDETNVCLDKDGDENDGAALVMQSSTNANDAAISNDNDANGNKNGTKESSSKEFLAADAMPTSSRLQLRRNSLDLRKMPPSDILLTETDALGMDSSARYHHDNWKYESAVPSSIIEEEQHEQQLLEKQPKKKDAVGSILLRRTCLNSKFCIREQLMLSFGTVSALTILLVVLVCILVTVLSGKTVEQITRDSFVQLAHSKEGLMARYLAEGLTLRLYPVHSVNIIREATRDRFSGYPDILDDSEVPFFDIDSQSSVYPIIGTPLPLDWQLTSNVNQTNLQEHVQHRLDWYESTLTFSTENAAYYMQGICDPSVDQTAPTYLENCTQANNDLKTGGVIAPSPRTNEHIHRKASDLGPLLKAIYEFHPDIQGVGVYFVNDGAGASASFPARKLHSSTTYISAGCDWMLQPNPYEPSRPIATQEMFHRCQIGNADGILRLKGTAVSARLYNPMDRGWCIDQVLNPEKVRIAGPFRSAWRDKDWLMFVGRSVFDRISNELIGCISMDFVLSSVESALHEAKLTVNSEVTVAKWDDEGTVVASTAWNMSAATNTTTVDQINVGVTAASFQDFLKLVNFSSVWDPAKARKKFENFVVRFGEFAVAAYPMPPPPQRYDPTYFPEFLAIKSLSTKDFQDEVDSVNSSVRGTVARLSMLSVVVGCVGLAFVVSIIFLVSHSLTLPMKFMNDISKQIMETFAHTTTNDSGIESSAEPKCTPKTELSETLAEFKLMVTKFSGSTIAKSMKVKSTELKNRFAMFAEFEDIYRSRQDPQFQYNFRPSVSPNGSDKDATSRMPGIIPNRLNFGSVVNDRSEDSILQESDISTHQNRRRRASPLFLWIVLSIVTPLLITTITISVYATYSISVGLAGITDDAKAAVVSLEVSGLRSIVGLRASFVAQIAGKSLLDNHLLSRFGSWILFGGVTRANSFTEFVTGTDPCKSMSTVDQCERANATVCDCSWGYTPRSPFYENLTCTNFSGMDVRKLQKSYFLCESDPASSSDNGDRPVSSFPNSTASTVWYDDLASLPGSHMGSNATSLGSLYGRTRAISALPLFQAMYNSAIGDQSNMGTMVAFEADGMVVGYQGCQPSHISGAQWTSTVENGGPAFRPALCPAGKYGYDPRCREWYATGRKRSVAENAGLYVTSPYLFATGTNDFGQSATSPIVNPKTNEHVGQTMVDFQSTPIFTALNSQNTPVSESGFPILITGDSNGLEADTVIGPGFSLGEEASVPIEQLVVPFDYNCTQGDCHHKSNFKQLTEKMKDGKADIAHFDRTTPQGTVETVYMAFAPVFGPAINPVDSSDFSRGVNRSNYLIYSLALAEPETGLLEPFEQATKAINQQIMVSIIVLSIVIVLAACFVIYMSYQITNSIVGAMIYLLNLIRRMNRLAMDGNPPGYHVLDRDYVSSEVLNVIDTMETLYRTVQSANIAFFAGDIEKAYVVLSDAARLFLRLENKKAEGVANNNLGNTMLSFYRTMEATGEKQVCGYTKRQIIGKGVGYFHRAIQLGEKAYDEFYETEGWSPSCLEFMQHLSNRYFNRGMFLLTVKDGHEKPSEIEELGKNDLQITKDMDQEIIDQGSEVGWNVRTVDIFEMTIGRIRGHLLLLELGYSDDWELSELLENAFAMVKNEVNNDPDSSPLFLDFKPAGRMQQVETELIRYKLLKGDIDSAAKIAIRILVEDEQTLPEAQIKAVEALVAYVKLSSASLGYDDEKSLKIKDSLIKYQDWLRDQKHENDAHARRLILDEKGIGSMPSSAKLSLSHSPASTSFCSELFKSMREIESTRGDVTMEVF